jgi:hypothetical protein
MQLEAACCATCCGNCTAHAWAQRLREVTEVVDSTSNRAA